MDARTISRTRTEVFISVRMCVTPCVTGSVMAKSALFCHAKTSVVISHVAIG